MSDNIGELCRRKLVEMLNGPYIWQSKIVTLGLFGGLGCVFQEIGRNLQSYMSASDQEAPTI